MKKSKRDIFKFFLAFVVVILLWGACWFSVIISFQHWETRGQFGDMFGVVNALFSGLAFAGIIVTILLQKKELALQRRELRLTRNEFKEQNETLWLQRFETTFFNLLALHNHVVEGASETSKGFFNLPPTMVKGRAFFDTLAIQVRETFSGHDFADTEYRQLRENYLRVFKNYFTSINLFLESVNRIAKFVYDSDLVLDAEKKFYYSILKSTLSESEKADY